MDLVWDASAVYYFARSERLDVLRHLAAPYRNLTTRVVMRELRRHQLEESVATPQWLEVVPLDELAELNAYVNWASRLGVTSAHNAGEATVLAWAQVHGAVAMVDDRSARLQGSRAGLSVHGSLWLIAQAVEAGRETESGVRGLLRTLSDAGARYPADAVSDFGRWARGHGLLL